MSDYWNRPEKNEIRQLIIDDMPVCSNGSLWMPGINKLDIIAAYNQKKLLPNSSPIVVERDEDVFNAIVKDIENMFPNSKFHFGSIGEYQFKSNIDFAFIDLCGSFEKDTIIWLNDQLKPHLEPNSQLVFTTMFGWRRNDTLTKISNYIKTNYMKMYSELRVKLGIFDDRILVPLIILLGTFKDRTFSLKSPIQYRDSGHGTMILYRLLNINKTKNTLDWFNPAEIIKSF